MQHRPPFKVTRNNIPIDRHPLQHEVHTGIGYSQEFAGLEACAAAHSDMAKWIMAGYPKHVMAKIMAWHRQHKAVEAHIQDANLSK